MKSIGTEEARKRLPELLERAYRQGKVTVITKRGLPYAKLMPIAKTETAATESLLALRGSGKKCFGADHVTRLRAEWD